MPLQRTALMIEEVVAVGAVHGDARQIRARHVERQAGALRLPQRADQGVAAREPCGSLVGIELHLPRERAVELVDALEGPSQDLAQQPHDALESPSRKAEAQVHTAPLVDHPIPEVPAVDHVVHDLVGGVHVATEAHAGLGEVPEFVSQHRFELAQGQHVHQTQPDDQVLPHGEQQGQHRAWIEHPRVHLGAQVDATGFRASGFLAQLGDESVQSRLLGLGHLHHRVLVRALLLEQPLEQEQEQHRRADDAQSR